VNHARLTRLKFKTDPIDGFRRHSMIVDNKHFDKLQLLAPYYLQYHYILLSSSISIGMPAKSAHPPFLRLSYRQIRILSTAHLEELAKIRFLRPTSLYTGFTMVSRTPED